MLQPEGDLVVDLVDRGEADAEELVRELEEPKGVGGVTWSIDW
jgi:hypothetical protein